MKFSPIALVGILSFLPSFVFATPPLPPSANVWAQAEAKIDARLKSIGPKISSVEFKSERLKKYLPEFRVFVRFDPDNVGQCGLILVNQDAEIIDLGNENWHGDAAAQYLGVPRLTEFLRARKIQVRTQQDAIEFTKFFERLQGAPGHIASLQANTEKFEERIIDMEYPSTDWKYTSVKREGGWKVMVEYVGDPSVSIMMPPTYEMDIDEQGNFRDLRRSASLTR
ncbi:MAG: hypothetical protein AB8D78_06305 [Akkermansiaceae bacterium]